MTEDRLADLERLHQQATPGPWEWRKPNRNNLGAIEPFVCSFGVNGTYDGIAGETPTSADADFICESRTALPELIAEVRRLRGLAQCREEE